MRSSPGLFAQVSKFAVHSKKSFERLDRTPQTAFTYYYQLQVQALSKCNAGEEPKNLIRGNNSFKQFVRRNWHSLSISKRRLYHALYFRYTRIDYATLNYEQVAKRLEIPIPLNSEYLLFRNGFRESFERKRDAAKVSSGRKSMGAGSSRVIKLLHISHNVGASEGQEQIITKNFQEMCRECKRVWKSQVTDAQKDEIREKVRNARETFESQVEDELNAIQGLEPLIDRIIAETGTAHFGMERSINFRHYKNKRNPNLVIKKK
ncbi:LAMI_0B02212g1_1 [Lachancea mirantina]|uniref:LAMI_0B02212g1_1 n=1 Tax=Lachancea mirantina TaxID=1230905 RepID=A0A1G4IU46_9SACH|nr:LAMI_0B02212g1_1 [Lachancea mirantina]